MTLKPIRALQFVLLSPLLLCIAVIVVPFVLLMWVGNLLSQFSLLSMLRSSWPREKFILLAYTDSPIWAAYIEQVLLPKIETHCIAVNRSNENWKRDHPLEQKAIAFWGGSKVNNPIVIVCQSRFRARTFRLYEEFRNYKHGKPAKLDARVNDLLTCIDSVLRQSA